MAAAVKTAVNTANTKLSYSEDGTLWKPLVDIIDYPDLGSTPNQLDTTTLSATKMKTSILGLMETPELTFEALYTLDAYKAINLLAGKTLKFKLEFGATAVDGAFGWDGAVTVIPLGATVDEVRKMQVTVSAESEIKLITA